MKQKHVIKMAVTGLLVAAMVVTCVACGKKDSHLKKITLNQ